MTCYFHNSVSNWLTATENQLLEGAARTKWALILLLTKQIKINLKIMYTFKYYKRKNVRVQFMGKRMCFSTKCDVTELYTYKIIFDLFLNFQQKPR